MIDNITYLTKRAAYLEDILDNSDEPTLPEVEEELCKIYKLLQRTRND